VGGAWLACVVAVVCLAPALAKAESRLVLFRSAPGQFEIVASDTTLAQAATNAAAEAWQVLAAPLALPGAFSSPVFVRLTPGDDTRPSVAIVHVEPGGIVSLSVAAAGGRVDDDVRRGLVRALLTKLVVTERGVVDMTAPPGWLEAACLGWWKTRSDPAQLDAMKLASGNLTPPALNSLLASVPGGTTAGDFMASSTWLLTFLQSESRSGEWPTFRRRVLRGDDPVASLAKSFPGRFASADERELWWQTGWHHLRRVRSLPLLEASDSRAAIERLVRFVVLSGDADAAMSLGDMLDHAGQPFVRDELAGRAAALQSVLPVLHPFYRNAGLSLARALTAGASSSEQRAEACQAFESDWRDALELEAATRAALDELEFRRAPESGR
jgi:hypothetical protein